MYRELYPRAAPAAAARQVQIPMGLITNVGQAASGITAALLTAFAGASLDSLKPNITGYLGKNMNLAFALRDIEVGNIHYLIEEVLKNDYDFIVDATKAGIGQGVGSIHASFFESLAGVNALMQSYIGTFHSAGIVPFVNRWANMHIRPNIPNDEMTWFMNRIGIMSDADFNNYMAENGWDSKFFDALRQAWSRPPPIDIMLELRRRGYMSEEALRHNMRWFRISDDIIENVAGLSYQVPESYRLALAAAKGIIDDGAYKFAMQWHGLDAMWSDVWKEQNYEYPSLEVMIELLRRGHIDEGHFNRWTERMAWAGDVRGATIKLREALPPASDLVTMVVREAFDPKMVVPAPEIFAAEMAKKGFSKIVSDRYWTMHFVPMPLSQAYDNLARGYWTKEQFLDLLRIADIHPMWREDIYNVAFVAPSIRELGYGFDVGVYDLEDIVRYRRYGRLSPEDADKSAVAMVAYRTEAEREAVRREHMHLYALDRETREEFEANLRRVWTNEAAIPLWLERGDLERERLKKEAAMPEPRVVSSSEALYAFRNKLRDESWTRAALADIGWVEDRITLAIERVKFEFEEDIREEKEKEAKPLTLTQLRDMYKYKRINRDQLVLGLGMLRYNEGDAEMLAQDIIDDVAAELAPRRLTVTQVNRLYEYSLLGMSIDNMVKVLNDIVKGEGTNSPTFALYQYYLESNYSNNDAIRLTLWTAIDLTVSRLRGMYSKGWITATAFVNGIVEIGIPMDTAEQIAMTVIKAEQPARTATERELTKSEIIKGVKAGVLTPNQGAGLLQNIGYDENEAWYLLYINAVVSRSDPETYWEMRKVTEQYKKARGEKAVDIPDELIVLDLQLRDTKAKLEKMKADKATEEEIGKVSVEIAGIQSKMRTMIGKLGIKDTTLSQTV